MKKLFCGIIILLNILLSCNDRTSSKERLEMASSIILPSDFNVLQDVYHDMLQDYCIIYDIKVNGETVNELTTQIKASRFYNPDSKSKDLLIDSLPDQDQKAFWYQSANGYHFIKQNKGTSYTIDFDTLTRILNYRECAD